MAGKNLYVHFPFCRQRCSYCTLFSRIAIPKSERDRYAANLAQYAKGKYDTIYFGGGSPALCDLTAILEVVEADEFTVELHPLDVTEETLKKLSGHGVNRISMGVQTLDESTLVAMGRMYTPLQAAKAFETVKKYFDNAGIDIILGYPGDKAYWFKELEQWGLNHCSVYSLQNERNLKNTPNDDIVLDMIKEAAQLLSQFGLQRYEISNYAKAGYECKHNLAVWRGEDYIGLGEGAYGREGLLRTKNKATKSEKISSVESSYDRIERALFSLRTKYGLDSKNFPEWEESLDRFTAQGLLKRNNSVYCLTERGTEVCDAIIAELI